MFWFCCGSKKPKKFPGNKHKTDLITSLNDLAAQNFEDDYINDILIPAINKIDLTTEQDKQLILEYLNGSDQLELNSNLIELVRNDINRALSYATSYTDKEAYNKFISPRENFLKQVGKLEQLDFNCPSIKIENTCKPSY